MKGVILSLFIALSVIGLKAQIFRGEEIKALIRLQYGLNYSPQKTAEALVPYLKLDNGKLVFEKDIIVEGATAQDLFEKVKSIAIENFTSERSSIKLMDKENNIIILEAYVTNVASHSGMNSSYLPTLHPRLVMTFFDGRVHIKAIQESFDMYQRKSSARSFVPDERFSESWQISSIWPFSSSMHYNTDCKTIVAIVTCSSAYISYFESVLTDPKAEKGNEILVKCVTQKSLTAPYTIGSNDDAQYILGKINKGTMVTVIKAEGYHYALLIQDKVAFSNSNSKTAVVALPGEKEPDAYLHSMWWEIDPRITCLFRH